MAKFFDFKILLLALTFALAACERQGDAAPQPPPKTVSQTFRSAEEAFNTVLNSSDRNLRYTATLYLKQKRDEYEGTIKGYGTVLFRVSHEHIRRRVYESMGWFGDPAVAAILTHYLTVERSAAMKLEILHALGEVGPDAEGALRTINQVSSDYSRLVQDLKGSGRVVVRGPSGEQEIDPAKMISAEAFQRAADDAMIKIRERSNR